MGIHLKDIIEGICRKAIQDENGKNIDSTYLKKTGDTKDNTITFESDDTENVNNWTNVNYLVSGEKQSSIFKKISTMFKNIRWIYNILSVDDIPNYIYGIKTEGKIGNTIKILNNMKAKASHVGVSESNGITNIQYNYPDGSNLMTVSGEDSLRTALYNATDKISSQVASLNTDITSVFGNLGTATLIKAVVEYSGGAGKVQNVNIHASSIAFAQCNYTVVGTVFSCPQPTDGQLNIYIRTPDGKIPETFSAYTYILVINK